MKSFKAICQASRCGRRARRDLPRLQERVGRRCWCPLVAAGRRLGRRRQRPASTKFATTIWSSHELYGGVEWVCRTGHCNFYTRAVFEMQNWHSDALGENSATDTISFVGPAIHGGVTF